MSALVLGLLIPLSTGLASAADLSGTLKKIKDSGVVAIGYRDSAVPFSFVGPDQTPTGYSIDLCRHVVGALQQSLGLPKVQIKWVPVNSDTRITGVAGGNVDLECGSTTNSLSRQEQVDFSHMTFIDGASLLVKKSDRMAAFQDLNGKKIAVIPTTTTDGAMRAALQKAFVNAQIVPVKEHREGLTMLENGTVDAYASDRIILIGLAVTAKDPSQFAISEQYFSYEPYGFMLRRGDAPFRLAVNRVLSSLYRSHEVMQIYARWFGKLGEPGNLLLAMYALHALPE